MNKERPKCNFGKCFSGMHVAAFNSCLLGGDPAIKDCPKFKDEKEYLKEWEKSEKEGCDEKCKDDIAKND